MKKLIFITLITLSVTAISSPYVKPSEPNGVVRFNYSAIGNYFGERISPVSLTEVDGERVLRRRGAVWLSPGKHTLRVEVNGANQVLGSNRFVRSQRNKNSIEQKTVDVFIEEGKIYFVGFDTRSKNPNDWQTVVWGIQDIH